MRRFIILLVLFGCGRQQADSPNQPVANQKSKDELYSLLEKLPEIKKPLTLRSNTEFVKDRSFTMDEKLNQQISQLVPGLYPYGKIYQADDFIAIVAIGPADILLAVLVTFDKNGKMIDSFNMYPDAGSSMGFYSNNIVTLTDVREILLTDSTVTLKTNDDGTDEIPGTDSVSMTMKKFRLNDEGRIEEIR